MLRFVRFNSCTTRFKPIHENYNTLRHIHFPGITEFTQGLKIQSSIVNANLDFKKLESKIKKQYKEIPAGFQLNEYETSLLSKILSMKPLPTLLTFEFDNVYTGGKKMKQDPNLGSKIHQYELLGCKYHQLERGGQVTWHGEGQLVAYTILDLKQYTNLSIRCFVDSILLRGVQNILQDYGLSSYLDGENPGVWMQNNPKDLKIASIGTNIQRAITSYGISFNINNDLKYLNQFEMCGIPNVSATSLNTLKPNLNVSVQEIGNKYAQQVARLLNITNVEHMNGDELKDL
jgi:lipoate-protein ligase B